jgi:uncharacterized membrane protein YfcA
MRFINQGAYDTRAALGLTLAGVPAVLIAAFIVRELPLDAVRWLVLAVVAYTSASMLLAARWETRQADLQKADALTRSEAPP